MRALRVWICALVLVPSNSWAQKFLCQNQDFEITCHDGRCQQSEGFTPASVSLDIQTRQLSLCMYSMCLEGVADKLLLDRHYIVAQGNNLKRNTDPGIQDHGVIVIERDTKSGSMVANGFVNPLTCETR